MKKTIIYALTMNTRLTPTYYWEEGDTLELVSKKKAYHLALVQVLDKFIKKDDEVTVISIKSKEDKGDVQKIEAVRVLQEKFDADFRSVFDSIGCSYRLDYVAYDASTGSSKEQSDLYKILIEKIPSESAILSDITYGPKYLPVILLAAVNYAEKYLGCELEDLVYGYADMHTGVAKDPTFYDMTNIYYLYSFGSRSGSSKEAFDYLIKTTLN